MRRFSGLDLNQTSQQTYHEPNRKPIGKNGEEQIQYGLNSFYLHPFKIGGIPNRIDIGIIYDLTKLESVTHYYKGREKEKKTDAYIFKDPNNKSNAILEIIRLL